MCALNADDLLATSDYAENCDRHIWFTHSPDRVEHPHVKPELEVRIEANTLVNYFILPGKGSIASFPSLVISQIFTIPSLGS